MRTIILLVIVVANFASSVCFAAERDEIRISSAMKDPTGILVHTVQSPYESSETKIRVLLPGAVEKGVRYSVLYVLPVEPGDGVRWGDGLQEVKRNDLHKKYHLICVQPTFSAMPWFADHPTNTKIRQETYFLKVVVPFIDKTYPTRPGRDGRLLLGFSKSGYGAFSLLLRHPDEFGKAVAWDAPLMMERPDKYGMAEIFGSQANFENYRLSSLLKKQASQFAGPVRLIHFGYGNFREHHQSAEKLMNELKISHRYHDGPKREHSWHSGWLPDAVKMLDEEPAGH